jgi:predicted alpha-1,2-mannosidase
MFSRNYSLPSTVALILLISIGIGCSNSDKTINEPIAIDVVDPFLGTGGHGHTFPGATTPFGMVQLSPDNGTQGWDWVSGYHYSDSVIAGFSHTHLSGTGIGDLTDISVMPLLQEDAEKGAKYAFSHVNEVAKPGYYSVNFENGIKAELTATPRTGQHRYSFPAGKAQIIAFDMGFAINWDKPTEAFIEIIDDSTIVGYRYSTGWARNQKVYFAARTNKAIQEAFFTKDGLKVPTENQSLKDVAARLVLNFGVDDKEPLTLAVGLSTASTDGAMSSLKLESQGIPQFEQSLAKAQKTWKSKLNTIQATFIEPAMDTIFYSALYHTEMSPNLMSDPTGAYKAPDSTIQSADNFDRYTVFSLWDTFRAANPLYLITNQELTLDFFASMMAFYDESGLLPVWALYGSETNTMTGYHAVPVLAEAIMKGVLTEGVNEVYAAMKKSAAQNIRGTNFYREYGYIPADKDGWSVTKTLEYAYDDWCIAQVANKLGRTEDYEYFMKRSKSYAQLFDASTEFMRGKNADGNWVEPFDPFYSEHGFEGIYIEGTAWQHSWFVPHDVEGLINLFGSKEAFANKLDATFEASSEMTGENVSVDISGLIGQYAHGNEPSHHIAYFYNFADQPWKTQEKLRQIMTELYTTGPYGLSGNDDCGQMSAWYIFSSLGFYPMNPVDGRYILGSPLVKEASINLPNGKVFEIEAKNNSLANKYVKSVSLNGKKLENHWFTYEQMMDGGKLIFEMTDVRMN